MKNASFIKRTKKFFIGIGSFIAFLLIISIAGYLFQELGYALHITEPTATFSPPTPTAIPVTGNLIDFIDQEVIEVRTDGAGIDDLNLGIRRLTGEFIEVEIQVGTYFLSHNEYVQNMVVVSKKTVQIDHDQWEEIVLQVACANKEKSIPETGDRFEILRQPENQELQMLMKEFETIYERSWEYYLFPVQQAAIWIVTNDSSYSSLGTLVTPGDFGFNIRVIEEDDAVRAMQLVDEAGIDITAKAIWADRTQLSIDLEDPQLQEWLGERAQ